uniref:Eco2 n=1 Tax=Hydra vulgaris TaxID=6087 RepID=A0A7G4YWG7_HYDVU|nr:Eco2 [Hydra vulgaris]
MKGYIAFILVNLLIVIKGRVYFDNEYFENGPNHRRMNLHSDPVENKDFLNSNNNNENMENFYLVEKKTDFVSNCLTANQKNCYNAIRFAGYTREASLKTCCQ